MKKILFATTALVATASVAAADVTFSGYGRFGVMYTGSMAQTAANVAAAAEAEARALVRLEAILGISGINTADDILEIDALSSIFEITDDNFSGLSAAQLDALVDALPEADQAAATTPFANAFEALDYGVTAASAQLARTNAYIKALTAAANADAEALVYNPETGKVAAVDLADVAAATAVSNQIDIAARQLAAASTRLGGVGTGAGAAVIAADVTAADVATVVDDLRDEANDLEAALAEMALIAPVLPAPVATDAIVSDMMITSRLRLNIDASAESDSGVTFGARIRIQQGEGEIGTANAARFYAKTGGLEVGVGNIYGAIEWMAGQYPIDLGLTGLGYEYTAYGVGGADAYSSGGTGASGRNGVEVMYSAGDFSAHISASDAADAASSDRVAANVAYTMGDWTVALGMQDSDAATDVDWTATVGGKIGGVSLGLGYAETNAGVDRTVMTVGMDVGAATNVEAYITDQSDRPDTGYGIDFNHSLGGGTSLRGGVASLTTGQTIADFGVRFNF